MKIGIHHRKGSFSDKWIEYCKLNHISYKLVNAYRYDIMEQLEDCDIFMWHFVYHNYKDMLIARSILNALEKNGKIVFPNFDTNWHFDDKIGEQYLLEAINAPVVPGYMFFTKCEAYKWIESTSFPKVFKLRGGAGSNNVLLVKNKKKAYQLACKAFGGGFSLFNRRGYVKDRCRQYREKKIDLFSLFKSMGRLIIPTECERMRSREKGYVYFQDFIPKNQFDIRVIVNHHRAFAIKRLVRKGDFRASGSGNILYDRAEIDQRCIELAFDVNKKINSQSLVLDFIFDVNNHPLIVELSYCYIAKVYELCPGYWTEDMVWHEGKIEPLYWQVQDVISEYNENM